MLKRRLTESFDLVYLHDPALDPLDTEVVAQYHKNGRELSDLGDLSALPENPSIFTVAPLKAKYEYLADQVMGNTSGAIWQIFRTHVIGVKDFIDEYGKPILTWTDDQDRKVEEKCRDLIPKDVVTDIATVIVMKANEISLGFTLPVRFWETRGASQARRAIGAVTEDLTDASQEN